MRNGRFVVTANDGVTIEDWYKDGKLHRDDGPATVISDGYKAWYWKGFFHRTNGPARIWGDGTKEWWITGCCYTKEKWWNLLSQNEKIAAAFNEENM
jgi:hypothetical protein